MYRPVSTPGLRLIGSRAEVLTAEERIYEARQADAQRLAELGKITARHWFSDVYSASELDAFLQRDFTAEGLRQQLAAPDTFTFLIHEVGGTAVGFARINWDRPVPFGEQRGAELQKIYYLPERTGEGLGRRLMAAAQETVAARGVRILWLDVLKSNPRARALYERLGFKVIGELPFATERGEIGMDVLCLELG